MRSFFVLLIFQYIRKLCKLFQTKCFSSDRERQIHLSEGSLNLFFSKGKLLTVLQTVDQSFSSLVECCPYDLKKQLFIVDLYRLFLIAYHLNDCASYLWPGHKTILRNICHNPWT